MPWNTTFFFFHIVVRSLNTKVSRASASFRVETTPFPPPPSRGHLHPFIPWPVTRTSIFKHITPTSASVFTSSSNSDPLHFDANFFSTSKVDLGNSGEPSHLRPSHLIRPIKSVYLRGKSIHRLGDSGRDALHSPSSSSLPHVVWTCSSESTAKETWWE